MRWIRKIVDERQEQEMLQVERGAFWVLFFGLAIVITVQVFAFDSDLRQIAGEGVVLVAGAVWALAGYLRRGIWDSFSKPGIKSYLIYSAVGALIFGLALPITRYFRQGVALVDCLLLFAVNYVSIFILAFVSLALIGSITKWRQKRLQQEFEDEK